MWAYRRCPFDVMNCMEKTYKILLYTLNGMACNRVPVDFEDLVPNVKET